MTSPPPLFADSLKSVVSMMGTSRDKAASVRYAAPLMDFEQLVYAYEGSWLPQKVVDIPAHDSCREWRGWQANPEQIELIEREEQRLGLQGKVLECRIKARLFGGSALMIGTGAANEEMALPLDLESVGKNGLQYVTVLTCQDLSANEIDYDPASEWFNRPKYYTLNTNSSSPLQIHPSRLCFFYGKKKQTRNNESSWEGNSVLLAAFDAIKNADSTASNIASLVFEAKIDVISIPNFMTDLANPAYQTKLLERYSLVATAKGLNGTVLLDAEEKFETKTPNLGGLSDILMSLLQIVSGAADIPMTRLLGQSPAGMSSTGDSDYRNYLDSISTEQRLFMTPAMWRLDQCLIRSALGKEDPSIYPVWSPLWQISEKDRADIDSKNAATAKTYVDSNLLPIEVLSKGVLNKLIDEGTYPGLEDAIAQFGSEIDEPKPNEADLNQPDTPTVPKLRLVSNDALPKTLYVYRPVLNAAEIIAWAKAQGFDKTLEASDMHVTIAYSRAPVDWMAISEPWNSEIKLPKGGARIVEKFDGGATVLLFKSSDLEYRHGSFVNSGATWDHPEYQPHITLSYDGPADLSTIDPYIGEIILGPEIFEEVNKNYRSTVEES